MSNSSLKFKTIAVATDLSGNDSSALRYAQAIAQLHQAKLVAIHIIDPLGYAFPAGAPSFIAANAAARAELKHFEADTHRKGIPVHSVIESGLVCERILQALTDQHADLLVLGTRGKTEAGRVALGTVARQLLAKATCPILTVSPDADAFLPWAGRWRQVLAATDFSAASVSALRCAHQMAHRQLIVFHASRCQSEGECSNCLGKLRFLAPFNESHTVPVDHIVTSGDASNLIAENARKFHVDLVVLGSPVNELSEEDFPESTVLQVISKVACPVLCVPLGNKPGAEDLIGKISLASVLPPLTGLTAIST